STYQLIVVAHNCARYETVIAYRCISSGFVKGGKRMLFPLRWHWVCCVLWTMTPAFGQAVSGSLLGTVTDNTEATVPGATVSILEVNTGAARTADTSESGNYVFPDLVPGTYTVAVTRQGFKKVTRERVEVLVNTSVRVDLTLPLGDVNEI